MTVSSNNFPIEGDYKILWSSSPKFDDGKTITLSEGTSPKGSQIVTASFSIPEAAYGMYYVGFIRLGRDDPTIFSFNVLPRLRVQPASASPGNTVTIYGTGLPANDAISLTFDSKPTEVNVTANGNGSFTMDFTIPSAIAEEHQISAKSSKLTNTIAPATMLVKPGIAVNPQSPQTGNNVTITGRGFAAKVLIAIKYNEHVITNSPVTDDTGNFTYSFTLPPSAETGTKFVATDPLGNTVTFSSGSKTPSPPPSPPPSPQPPSTPGTPQSPGTATGKTLSKPATVAPKEESFGLFGAQEVTFVWTQASSFPGNITYTLEVSDNYKFQSVKPGMKASGIAQTNHTLKLESGTYYWRVKAVDSFGNESEWANSRYSFKVGSLPVWLIVVGAIIYIVIFWLLVRTLLRRRNRDPYYDY